MARRRVGRRRPLGVPGAGDGVISPVESFRLLRGSTFLDFTAELRAGEEDGLDSVFVRVRCPSCGASASASASGSRFRSRQRKCYDGLLSVEKDGVFRSVVAQLAAAGCSADCRRSASPTA